MTQLTLDIHSGALSVLRLSPTAFAKELKTAAVIQWYAEQRLSQSKACEILEMSRSRFLHELFQRHVPAVQITAKELQQEIYGEL
ncbi:hypothetical protein TI05_04610 [Achromatium sp. WMS3]|nr:hypothetical protein TI05_04610 [Achromatium sp. WMS3]